MESNKFVSLIKKDIAWCFKELLKKVLFSKWLKNQKMSACNNVVNLYFKVFIFAMCVVVSLAAAVPAPQQISNQRQVAASSRPASAAINPEAEQLEGSAAADGDLKASASYGYGYYGGFGYPYGYSYGYGSGYPSYGYGYYGHCNTFINCI